MKRLWILITVILLTTAVTVSAQPTKVMWDAPTTNIDGTPLTDLDHYKVYCGASSGNYTIITAVPITPTEALLADICTGIPEPFIVVTAVDDDGNESGYSNEANCDLNAPQPPTGTRCSQ